jgi:hypothetical protein
MLTRRAEDEDPPHLKEKFQSLKSAYLLLPQTGAMEEG